MNAYDCAKRPSNRPWDTAPPSAYAHLESDLLSQALHGLAGREKTIPSALLFDATGSALYRAIVDQPEYYPDRVERSLLKRFGRDIARAAVGSPCDAALVEFGASDESKALHLLDAEGTRFSDYVAVNVDPSVLDVVRRQLARSRPALQVGTVVADFSAPLAPLSLTAAKTVVAYLAGNTLAQFEPHEALRFLGRARELLSDYDCTAFIIGSDICRDVDPVLAAYDDAAGFSSAFNLNVLEHLNRLGDGDFDRSGFEHAAQWNASKLRVELSLVSRRAQRVRVAGRTFEFVAGERMLTAVSYRRSLDDVRTLASLSGWKLDEAWTEPDVFSILLLRR